MDIQDVSETPTSLIKDFDQIVEKRAEKYQHLRGRNNMTSCRSPARDLDTKSIKDMLQHKRHLEFQRRRSGSPPLYPDRTEKSSYCSTKKNQLAKEAPVKHQNQAPMAKTVDEQNEITSTSQGGPTVVLTSNSIESDYSSPSKWASLWSEDLPLIDHKEDIPRQKEIADFTTLLLREKSIQKNMNGTKTKRENAKHGQQGTNIKDFQTEMSSHVLSDKTGEREASVRTGSGFVMVKALDVQQLAEYLQEALCREEALEKKMAALQQSVSSLLNSPTLLNISTARCSEDLLKDQITSLEGQLQLCLQRLPKDGLKKLVVQMERQKLAYEQKALAALQKTTLEKTEALVESNSLQGALNTAKADVSRWQDLYEEQKQTCVHLKECHKRTSGQVEELHSQLELSRSQQADLRGKTASLQRVHEEMQHNISLLEQTNQMLSDDIHLKASPTESWDFAAQVCLPSEEPRKVQREEEEEKEYEEEDEESAVVQELCYTQERLRTKERECVDLEAELEATQQEYRSSQAQLMQCRDQLRLLSQPHSSTLRSRRSWTRTFVFLMVLGAFIGVAMLTLWHLPFRDQVADIFSGIETRIEDYLMEMASQQHCYRPV